MYKVKRSRSFQSQQHGGKRRVQPPRPKTESEPCSPKGQPTNASVLPLPLLKDTIPCASSMHGGLSWELLRTYSASDSSSVVVAPDRRADGPTVQAGVAPGCTCREVDDAPGTDMVHVPAKLLAALARRMQLIQEQLEARQHDVDVLLDALEMTLSTPQPSHEG